MQMVILVPLEVLEPLVEPVRQVPLGSLVQLDLLETRVKLDHRVSGELLVQPVHRDLLEHRVRLAPQAVQALRDQLVL